MSARLFFFLLSVAMLCPQARAQSIVGYEYWIDHQHEQRVRQTGSNTEILLTLPTDTLAQGIHTLTFRAQDSRGLWSSPYCQYFVKMNPRDPSSSTATLTKYEYWIDHRHEQRITLTAPASGIISINLQTETLAQGIHTLTFRAQDSRGQWSSPYCQYFVKMNTRDLTSSTTTLTKYEYWIDHRHEQRITLTAPASGIISINPQTDTLAQGIHTLTFRAQDSRGQWSSPYCQYFVKMTPQAEEQQRNITAYRYWFNGMAEDVQTISFDEPASPMLVDVDLPTRNLLTEIDATNISLFTDDDGLQQIAVKNVLYSQFRDSRGSWSQVRPDTFAVAVGNRVASLTAFITNPEADLDWTGWTVSSTNGGIGDNSNSFNGKQNKYFALGTTNGRHNTVMTQTISGLPAGKYVLTAIGRAATGAELTMTANGYSTMFPAMGDTGGELWENAEADEPEHLVNEGQGYGWSQRSIEFVTDGSPFDISAQVSTTDATQWADIDAFTLTVNGVIDNVNTLQLKDIQLAAGAPNRWIIDGQVILLDITGRYTNKKQRTGNVYYSVDGGNTLLLTADVEHGEQFSATMECLFRQSANPHTITLYGRDSEGVVSAQTVIEIGNMSRGCQVEGLPDVAIYSGSPIEAEALAVRDKRTRQLLDPSDYSCHYINNVDEGTATITVEGLYPNYIGSVEATFPIRSYIAADELATLRMLYNQTSGSSQWSRKWNLASDSVRSDQLWGVTARNNHVTAIHLVGNRLTGTLAPEAVALPQLQALHVENNHLSHLSGLLPATLQTVALGGQQMDDVVAPLTLTPEGLTQAKNQLPNICFYHHQDQTFERNATFRLRSDRRSDPALAVLTYSDGQWTAMNSSSGNYVYRKASGDTLCVTDDAGNTFRATLSYLQGDANFDGTVSVLDLSALVMHYHGLLNATLNFGAANLMADERLNVQDAVCMVNLLLSSAESPDAQARQSRRQMLPRQAGAVLSNEGYVLMLSAATAISAFDIVLADMQAGDVSSLLPNGAFALSISQQAGDVRIIGYSPGGEVLPEGETPLLRFHGKARVKRALLADDQAHAVSVDAPCANGIDDVDHSTFNVQRYYDLSGRKLQGKPTKSGIYIRNKQKIHVK